MESLCYAFEGRGLLFLDDIELPDDMKPLSDDDKSISFPIRGVGGMEYMESGLPDMKSKLLINDPGGRVSTAEMNDHSNTTTILNSFPRETEFASRFSSSAIRAGDKKSLQINFENEKSAAITETHGTPFSKEKSLSSSPKSSFPAKRSRNTDLHLQLPVCQVYGCNKDLSSSKDYHKRHRVCDVHSKTPIVIVNGTKQRFCQQCSRFHMLGEFDEGKRSCRERLAGHNKRRRKLHLDTCIGILPGGFFAQGSCEPKLTKLEGEPSQMAELAVSTKFWQSRDGLFQYPSKNCPESTLSIQELPQSSNSGYALSLLSDQSLNLLSNSTGIPMAFPLIFKENHQADCQVNQNSVKPPGTGFEVQKDELCNEANALAAKNYNFPQVAETVDLLELSFHLQRVEQQRYSAQVKQENDIFWCSTIT